VTLKHGDKLYEAQWACDLIVDPEFRKLGTGKKLFEAGIVRDKITLGNNPSPNAEALMLKSGFKPINSGRLMVFPIDPLQVVSWAIPKKYSFAVLPVSKLIKPYFSYKKNNLKKSSGEYEICSWKEAAELLIRRQQKNKDIHILHDGNFLKWRASGFQNYFPEVRALRTSSGSYALFSFFKPYFNIYEWYCANVNDFKSMFSELLNIASHEKALTVQIVSNNDKERQLLSGIGFIRSRNNEKIIYYSTTVKFPGTGYFYFTLYDTDLNL